MDATSVPRRLIRILKENKQMKIASFLAMTTILIAHGRKEGRQHKNGCHWRRNDAAIFLISIRVV